VFLEPIVGPGGIAWSTAALVVVKLANFVADRSSKAWFAFGAVGTVVVLVVHRLVLMLLGVNEPWRWIDLASSVGVTALWCGLVGFVLSLDVPARWRAYRARKLR
jgi:fumarate reductase subunit D